MTGKNLKTYQSKMDTVKVQKQEAYSNEAKIMTSKKVDKFLECLLIYSRQ